MKLAGWGRFPVRESQVIAPRTEQDLLAAIARGGNIARGNGRGYGDCAIGSAATLSTRHLRRMLAFDPGTGVLVAESGVLLDDVIAAFLPRGWFPAVTPGTRFVTLGGMLAADVHGKNHHRDGSCRNFVEWFDLAGPDGAVRRCSRSEHPELFDWTLGGMGLTGVILRAAVRLRRVETGWIRQTTTPARDLDHAIELFETGAEASYSVAWIDSLARGATLGRSLVTCGEHTGRAQLPGHLRDHPFPAQHQRPLRMPFDAPAGLLNRISLGAFNRLYHWHGRRQTDERLVEWERFFYPLDAIREWNRIYGRRGFAQFQCVLPLETARAGLREVLETTSQSRNGSFLAVLKRFGEQDGAFSFPMPGYTLALDFAVNAQSLALLGRLDRIVIAHGGRFYLAKDSRMTPETLHLSDPRSHAFNAFRQANGMASGFRSIQSERLGI